MPGHSQPAAVHIEGVSHAFNGVPALNNLSFTVPHHAITVLLGPNGAGKTTAIRLITGALTPDSGSVNTLGLSPATDGTLIRHNCGVVAAKPALYDRLSGWENLRYAAELYGLKDQLGTSGVAERINEAATQFGIEHALENFVGGYSTGMKTRLALARAVLHRPRLLLFDEPTSGLDPESAHAVLDHVRSMPSQDCTVVMCTHLLAEAEGLADHVVMMDTGTDLISGPPVELTRRFWPYPKITITAATQSSLIGIQELPGVIGVEPTSRGVSIELDSADRTPDIVGDLVRRGVQITSVQPFEPNLEQLYFKMRQQHRATVATELTDLRHDDASLQFESHGVLS